MNHAAIRGRIPRRHVRDDACAKSSSPRPKTDSSPCQNACARRLVARQDRARSRQDPQGSGVSRCFSTRYPRVFTWDYDERPWDYEENSSPAVM